MKFLCMAMVMCLFLSSCLGSGGSSGAGASLRAYDGISEQYPGDAQSIAGDAAREMAERFPPGQTSLSVVKTGGLFCEDFENALRGHGFSVGQGAGLEVGYILDEVRDEAAPTSYLQVRTSDGGSFGLVRPLTKRPRSDAGAAIQAPLLSPPIYGASESAIRELPLPAPPPDTSPAEPVPPAVAAAMAPAVPASGTPPAAVPQFTQPDPLSAPMSVPVHPGGDWSIVPGKLHAQLAAWAAQASYQLVWKAQNDFEMESHVSFRGSFTKALQDLFTGMHKRGIALRVTIFQGNQVVEVVEE